MVDVSPADLSAQPGFQPEPLAPGYYPGRKDPSELILRTEGTEEKTTDSFLNNAYQMGTQVPVSSQHFLRDTQHAVEQQAYQAGAQPYTDGNKTPGTLRQIVISTHGDNNTLLTDGIQGKEPVSMDQMLDAIGKAQHDIRQKTGNPDYKIADRLVIAGCDVFAGQGMPDDKIAHYSQKAQDLGMDIVGSTSGVNVLENGTMRGEYVKFGKDGSIGYDKIAHAPIQQDKALEDHPGGNDWVASYANTKNAQEGAQARDAPATLSQMFKQMDTKALQKADPDLVNSMKQTEQQYTDNSDPKHPGTIVQPNDAAHSAELRKQAADTADKLADTIDKNPQLVPQNLQRQGITPADASSQLREEATLARKGLEPSHPWVAPGSDASTPPAQNAPATPQSPASAQPDAASLPGQTANPAPPAWVAPLPDTPTPHAQNAPATPPSQAAVQPDSPSSKMQQLVAASQIHLGNLGVTGGTSPDNAPSSATAAYANAKQANLDAGTALG